MVNYNFGFDDFIACITQDYHDTVSKPRRDSYGNPVGERYYASDDLLALRNRIEADSRFMEQAKEFYKPEAIAGLVDDEAHRMYAEYRARSAKNTMTLLDDIEIDYEL